MDYVLEAINITKRFPGVLANDNVCLNVLPGEVLGLIGENGAGKSTILKVLNGIYPHGTYTGTLKLNGNEIKPTSPFDATHMGIGYVPQEINVLKYFSVAENIYMSDLQLQRIKGENNGSKCFVDFKTMYRATEELLKKNHINLDPHADVRKLSIGQQQMLMIARALATDPKVLILDEPTRGVDVGAKAEIYEIMNELTKAGLSIIMISSELPEIINMSDRVYVMYEGKITGCIEQENISQESIMHLATLES